MGAAVVAVALLAGCVSVPEPPAPPTRQELEQLRAEEARYWWNVFGDGEPMPEITVIEVLPPEEAYARQAECFDDAQLPGVTVHSAGGWTYEGPVEEGQGVPDAIERQWWLCSQQYPMDYAESGVMSESELAWLYDFYLNRYRPCVASMGFAMNGLPSRAEFVGEGLGYVSWFPYDDTIYPAPTRAEWRMIAQRCPLPSMLEPLVLPAYDD